MPLRIQIRGKSEPKKLDVLIANPRKARVLFIKSKGDVCFGDKTKGTLVFVVETKVQQKACLKCHVDNFA